MIATEQAIVLVHAFVDRYAWFLAVGDQVHGRDVTDSLAELRMVQVRAGIACVAIHDVRNSPAIAAAYACYGPEWRPVTAEEKQRLQNFFAETSRVPAVGIDQKSSVIA